MCWVSSEPHAVTQALEKEWDYVVIKRIVSPHLVRYVSNVVFVNVSTRHGCHACVPVGLATLQPFGICSNVALAFMSLRPKWLYCPQQVSNPARLDVWTLSSPGGSQASLFLFMMALCDKSHLLQSCARKWICYTHTCYTSTSGWIGICFFLFFF